MLKRVRIKSSGSYEKLLIEEAPIPILKSNQLLIECRACGVNFADCCVRMGVYRSAKVYEGWPITPGFEVSGIIKEIGSQVEGFSIGQKVIGITRFGGYASHITLDSKQVFPLPETMSFSEGAAFPAIFLTADYGLLCLANPKEGETLLIHSAAGGVGSALIQLGKMAGCRVIGVVGASHKIDAARALGADAVIDKSNGSLWQQAEQLSPQGYDIILDPNGPETLKQSYQHLSLGGRLVVYGFHTLLSKGRGTPNWFKILWGYFRSPSFDPMQMTTDSKSVLAFNLSYFFDRTHFLAEEMEKLLRWFKEGKIHLPKIEEFPFGQVQNAHKVLESGQTTGKIVLVF